MSDPQPQPEWFYAFAGLVLTLSECSIEGVCTDHEFTLQATRTGADVFRASVLHGPGGSCFSGERFVGSLTSRQVIELLETIVQSGVYEALPAMGLVAGATDPDASPTVSMRLLSREREHQVLDHAPADRAIVSDVTEAVRRCVDLAMERALTSGG
ncbi:MAG: hypothetical protein JWN41_1105 [Thermoleophilia bacterium]|nr:hypothetical protein [Thermoleophilia bacterium]